MKFVRNIVRAAGFLFVACIGTGVIVSKVEKRKGWSGGHKPYGAYEKYIKRPLDFGLALFAILLLWPLFGILNITVRNNIGSPVIFTQPRPGLAENIFLLKKYRTMTEERDANGKLLSDDKRLTKFGARLRSTSIDEIPEIVNILKGEMSIVGPRPQLVRDMVFMSDWHRKRHDVRPGLTGLAQVSGRNGISWEEKLDTDLKYIERITFLGDLKIVIQTVKKVFIKDGINEKGQATGLDYGDWLLANGKVSQEEYAVKQKEAGRLIDEVAKKNL